MARITRNPSPPKIRIPVLNDPAALEAFERAIGQAPEYGEDLVDGYIPALIWQNSRDLWSRLFELAGRGIVWIPEEKLEQLRPLFAGAQA